VIGPVTSGRKVARPVRELALAAGIAPIAPAFPASRVTGFPVCDWVISEAASPP